MRYECHINYDDCDNCNSRWNVWQGEKMINCKNIIGDEEWLYVVVVLVSKVMVGVVGGTSLQVEICIVLIIKGKGSIRVSDVEWLIM